MSATTEKEVIKSISYYQLQGYVISLEERISLLEDIVKFLLGLITWAILLRYVYKRITN